MKDTVKEYYGKVLQHSGDLQTNACCTDAEMPGYLRTALSNIHDEVMTRYYGCGLVSPQLLEGTRILDLGSGSGRDCYALGQMVGESGYVLGVDMTDEQLEVADRHIEWHRDRFGYAESNVEFRKGYIEKLDELGLEENSFDIIVSNCVINLSPDKEAVLREAYRRLKPGGELYFSDVYSDRRVPEHLIADPVLYGECLSGALYWNDFQNLAKKAGFADPRLVEDRPITIDNPEIEEKIGHIGFYSATYRLFKLDGLEPACEDYGQAVVYKGGIPESEQTFALDDHHIIEKGRMFLVCGNTYRMLNETRFSEYFEFYGNWDTHYGIFDDCGSSLPFKQAGQGEEESAGGGCC
ncbi:MAG: methyltransferase domain-containing protein [gamma proteobacterium endosymbiont of Lamellibrachia anaximandri]|nr:methyltransferase domain-containing protein [gamma proteobacterium endosymbiont of Lamellibrachia anaximandri]MBL3618440.1 methyltransferase domain-containing protein [gamma proteobacterium endosymbiont of Lamellibrachia anaximandri]